ncbi:unnamed protein product [Toxocara canis]|uniref:STAR_dimer domain-containing protein n=1 Tax=Toxocara canis TaxID=6265 RepID=A0A183U2K4_TOXCA|nr:unnamed protein product [Toxocara canis]
MITRIETATRNVEETLNNNDLQNRLIELSRTIESYDAVDSDEFEKIFPMKCDIRLADPMPFIVGPPQFRRVYLRGDLKIKDGKQGAKVSQIVKHIDEDVDTHCILFTDLFLVCKATNKRADRLRILKPPMHIAKICLQQFADYCTFCCIRLFCAFRPLCSIYVCMISIFQTFFAIFSYQYVFTFLVNVGFQ